MCLWVKWSICFNTQKKSTTKQFMSVNAIQCIMLSAFILCILI